MGKPITKTMLVCSRHFLKEDFYLPDVPSLKPRLLKSAVPSQNLPEKKRYEEKSEAQKVKRFNRLVNRRNLQNPKENADDSGSTSTNCVHEDFEEQWTEEDKNAAEVLISISNMPPTLLETNNKKTYVDKATLVKSGDLLNHFVENIDSDAKLSSLTGIPTLKMLDVIVTFCKKFSQEKRQRKLSLRERIILTFIKLKTGLKYVVISVLFNAVTPNTCKTIFHETICLLAKVLQPVIRWPTLEECQNNLPKCFKKFSNVRVVLDCTEIPLSTPKCLCCRLKTYSHYKGRQTIKFMTGVSPAGVITFISSAYGGRASDKAIFEQSNIVKKLTMAKDNIMVDKGFQIGDICKSHAIKVIQPPYLCKPKKQLTREEALLNVDIARARVHIERCNQRIKVFEIFSKSLPLSLVPVINEIFIVICAIVNLSASILADDKF